MLKERNHGTGTGVGIGIDGFELKIGEKSLLNRIRFTNESDDKENLSRILENLPYDLVNGKFDLIARYESFVGTIGIFPANKSDLIEEIKFEENGNYRFTCNFEEGYTIINNKIGGSIVIYKEKPKNAGI